MPLPALKPFPEGPLVPPAADLAIAREDLVALVARLQHEHFTYDVRGYAALRALKVLTAVLERNATLLVIAKAVP
jgi:hypothetical protein